MRSCIQCGFELPPNARFCAQCGARADDAAAPPAASLPAGERRQVAVLFADLAGYTRLSSTQDPERTHALLTKFFELVDGVIERFGGTIDKHIGDAVMGVFGAPVAYGNDVERALRAAIAIHDAVARLPRESGRPFGTHIGIASGEVIAATTGSAAHRNYTVTGDAVNLASRLTDLASSGETVVSEGVAQAGSAFAHMEPLGCVTIRGLPGGIRAWKLGGVHVDARAAQPLVGRDAERKRFADLLARASSECKGALVVLRADPGMGKTRLAEALLADARAASAQCHAATVLDFGAASGHDAIHALACSLLDVPPAAATAGRRAALDRAIASSRVRSDDEPWLADLLLIPQRAESLYEAMDDEAHRSGKLRALAQLAETAAIDRPVVLLVEDVHWASEWVLVCLHALAGATERAPVVLALTTRRDGDPVGERWPESDVILFDLPPLARNDALALARSHLAAAPDIAERCVTRAQGNPLFLMQLLRSDTDEEAVPPTIQTAVLARLDRLPQQDKSALQAAAVVGQRFPLDLLRHLVGDPGYFPAVPVARELLRGDDRGDEMMFTHALIRDSAYASLLHASRRELHHKAASWYEGRDPALCAEHLDRAEDARAADAYLAAARAEANAMRTEAAVSLVTRGRQLPSGGAARFGLASLAGELYARLGHAAESIAAFESALDAAADDRERAAAWIGVASGHRMQSAITKGLVALDAAEESADRAGVTAQLARIAYLRGSLHFSAGAAGECRRHHERALALAQQADDAEYEARALSGIADALYAQGKMRSAQSAFRRCLDICERAGLTRLMPTNLCMVAIVDALFGRIDNALTQFREARRLAHGLRDRFAETMCEESTGFVLAYCGRYADAAEPLTRGIALARTVAARRFEVILYTGLALVRAHDGRDGEARTCLEQAWSRSNDVGPRFAGPLVLGAKARLAVSDDERRAALADGERLLREECVAHCHLAFYHWGIEALLEAREWPEVDRYADRLEQAMHGEPLPVIELLVARARALAEAGRGEPDLATLRACLDRARAWDLTAYVPALEAAVAVARA
ncbi:MAG TPA: adenylate/guanylate cyclase domain-containing protein [Casimicrobiaceae bacterium]|nr:adenylate/guanylate cyclase domain-containing protein [Casimicrobiaceae bacterium]